jgi:hypothetical protein
VEETDRELRIDPYVLMIYIVMGYDERASVWLSLTERGWVYLLCSPCRCYCYCCCYFITVHGWAKAAATYISYRFQVPCLVPVDWLGIMRVCFLLLSIYRLPSSARGQGRGFPGLVG